VVRGSGRDVGFGASSEPGSSSGFCMTTVVAVRVSMIARAGQIFAAWMTLSISSAGTCGWYARRPSLRSWKICGASCSQKPNRTQRPGSTLTVACWARNREPARSPIRRALPLTWLDVNTQRPITTTCEMTTGIHTAGTGSTCRPEMRRCAVSSVYEAYASECSARHLL
jgi:hypothetical protein